MLLKQSSLELFFTPSLRVLSYLCELPSSHSFCEALRHLTLAAAAAAAAAAASPPDLRTRQRWSEQKGVMGVEEPSHVISYTNDQ